MALPGADSAGAQAGLQRLHAHLRLAVPALSLGLLLRGVLTDLADRRWIFYVNVPVGIAIVAGAARVLPAPARLPGRFDVPGAVLSTAGLTSGVYGVIRAAEQGWTDAGTLAALAAGVLLLAGFAVNESRHTHAVFPLRLLASRNRVFAYAVAG